MNFNSALAIISLALKSLTALPKMKVCFGVMQVFIRKKDKWKFCRHNDVLK